MKSDVDIGNDSVHKISRKKWREGAFWTEAVHQERWDFSWRALSIEKKSIRIPSATSATVGVNVFGNIANALRNRQTRRVNGKNDALPWIIQISAEHRRCNEQREKDVYVSCRWPSVGQMEDISQPSAYVLWRAAAAAPSTEHVPYGRACVLDRQRWRTLVACYHSFLANNKLSIFYFSHVLYASLRIPQTTISLAALWLTHAARNRLAIFLAFLT